MTKIPDAILGQIIINTIMTGSMVSVEVQEPEEPDGVPSIGYRWQANAAEQLGKAILEEVCNQMPDFLPWPDIPTQQKFLQHAAKVARLMREHNQKQNQISYRALMMGVTEVLKHLTVFVNGCRNMSLVALALGAKEEQ